MKLRYKITCLFFLIMLSCLNEAKVQFISLSSKQATHIGYKIWHNECNNRTDQLVFWKKGEEFLSLGIGHFIWHPAQPQACQFQDTFPLLVRFMEQEKVIVPPWIKKAATSGCPWKSAGEFALAQKQEDQRIKLLTNFLVKTIDIQAQFMKIRLLSLIKKLPRYLSKKDLVHVEHVLNIIGSSEQGMYALIDYLHCKGEGLGMQEQYNGKAWGLIAVLKEMDQTQTKKDPIGSFVQSAKKVLQARVRNAPPHRNEEQWLKGWFNRINTYQQNDTFPSPKVLIY